MGGGGETTETDCQWVVEITRKLQSLKRDQVNFIDTTKILRISHSVCITLYQKLKKIKAESEIITGLQIQIYRVPSPDEF